MKSGKTVKPGRHGITICNQKIIDAIGFIMAIAFPFCLTLAHASAGGGEAEGGRNWSDFAWRTVNFAVLAGLLYWILARRVKDFFSGRRKAVKAGLEEMAIAREEARRKFEEYDDRLSKATDEIKGMAEMIRAQGLAEKEKIIADALRTADKMKEDSQKRMEQEMKQARSDLRAEAVHLSVQLAQEILRKKITASDHAGLVRDYIEKVASKN